MDAVARLSAYDFDNLYQAPQIAARVESSIGPWCVSPRTGGLSCQIVQSGHAARFERFWRGHRS
jgi:hypothetical protein